VVSLNTVLGWKILEMDETGETELIPGLFLTQGILEILSEERRSKDDFGGNEPPDPFRPGNLMSFLGWLQEPTHISKTGLPRYMEAVFRERPDLRRLMPEVEHGELSAFAHWSESYGRSQVSNFLLLGHKVPGCREVSKQGRVRGGTDVIGLFSAEDGVGESARLLVEALRTASVPVSTLNVRNTQSRQQISYPTDEIGQYRTILSALNPELLAPNRSLFGDFFFRDTYVIGQWFWELEEPPRWYSSAYKYVNELWAPSRFIESMLRENVPKGVTVTFMPLPLRTPVVVNSISRSDFGLGSEFVFLFVFDFRSVMKRKNPSGLVEAFKRAFSNGEGPKLVIKCVNGDKRLNELEELKSVISDRDDIVLLDKYLDSEMSAALMNLCDCYVSLHRSEGLGLTIAEAMLLGKPVIATGYSGNLDFMTPDTSYVVPWTRVKVGKGAEAYSSRATWAEPNLDVAAEMMRTVYENPEEAQAVAKAGKRDLEQRFTREITGARMKARLEEIWESLDGV